MGGSSVVMLWPRLAGGACLIPFPDFPTGSLFFFSVSLPSLVAILLRKSFQPTKVGRVWYPFLSFPWYLPNLGS